MSGSRRYRLAMVLLCLAPVSCSTGGPGKAAIGQAKPSPVDQPSAAPTTVVSLSFDNASADQYVVRSLLAAHGMKATFFLSSGVVGRDLSTMNWAEVRSLVDDGHEIGGKTVNHIDLTTSDAAEARRQICDDRQNLIRRGFSVTDFAYPYAAVNPAVEALVKECGYNSGRKVGGIGGCAGCAVAGTIPPSDRYSTLTLPVLSTGVSVPEMQQVISAAEEAGGGWIQLVFFNVCDGCAGTPVRPPDLAALLEWLAPRAARGTVVKTVREALDGSLSVQPGRRPGSG